MNEDKTIKAYRFVKKIIEDIKLVYKVIEVFKNSAVVETVDNSENYSCEIMSFVAMEEEGWFLPNIK